MHSIGGYVTLKASATGLVDRIEFRVQRFAVDSTDRNSTETELSPVLFVWACDPTFAKKSLTCSHQMAFSGDGQMIEFHARAVFWNGTHDDEVYKFASGEFPVPDAPIPIRVKRHTDDGIDVIIVPHPEILDVGYADPLASFRKYLDDLIDGILFNYAPVRDYRGLYNFWYSPKAAGFDTNSCVFEETACDLFDIETDDAQSSRRQVGDNQLADAEADNPEPNDVEIDDAVCVDLELFSDALMYVHYSDMRDCALNKRFSTELWYEKSVVHEFGHALVELRDEYRVSSSEYGPQDPMPNIFKGEVACRREARLLDLPEEYCVSSTAAFDFWRIDPTGANGCMMGPSQHLAWSDFGPACKRRIKWRHDLCEAGLCFN